MHISRKLRLALSPTVASLLLVAPGIAAAAPSTTAITPGQVAFASDRPSAGIATPAADGSDARIWVSASPFAAVPGAPVQVTFEPTGVHLQHRDPDWSPDRTQIAFAAGAPVGAGDPATVPAEIRVLDLRTGVQRSFAPAALGQDDPAFSPDGTKIAFVAGGKLMVKAADASAADAPQTVAAGVLVSEPSWSSDGSELYFTRDGAGGRDIWKVGPLGGATTETRVVTASSAPTSEGVDTYDPAVSPDGSALCYSRTLPDRDVPQLAERDLATGQTSTIVTSSDGGTIGGDPLEADERCAWAPDGSSVLFTATPGFPATLQGVASDLHLASISDATVANPSLTGTNDAGHFDGSADWAANLAPQCAPRHATVATGGTVAVALSCVDPDRGAPGQAPSSEPIDPAFVDLGDGTLRSPYRIVDPPADLPGSGHIEGAGGVRSDGTVVFDAGAASGTVTFTYTATDGTASGAPATVTIDVTGGTNGGGGGGGGGGNGGGPGTNPGGGTPAPVLTLRGAKLSPRTWTLGRGFAKLLGPKAKTATAHRGRLVHRACVAATRKNRRAHTCVRLPVGTTISFRTNEAAKLTVGFQRALAGRSVGGRCVAVTAKNRRKRHCTRYAKAQNLTPIAVAGGAGRLHFEGRLSRTRKLLRGARYRVVLRAQDAAGTRTPVVTGPTFTVAKRPFTAGKR
jgi:dipeptidyl aminopeptidase/acylaminoacyl peptidase